MISRRNIRVKVMQTLYALEAQEDAMKPGEPVRILQKHFDQSGELLAYLLYIITEVARYAETDSRKRASKHLPSEQDRNVNIKLAGNEHLWKMLEDPSLKKAWQAFKPQLAENKEQIKRIYQELTGTEQYKRYIGEAGREKRSEKEMLEFIYNDLMLPSESFMGHIEELFTNWDDDVEMINQLLSGYIHKPQSVNFQEIMSKEKWEFARNLLETVMEKKELLMDLIRPKLKNWDPDRIATLDMILMQLGVSEFLFFETIPPKVTINEYIDLAKEYSTPQSGQFVNGILDSIHKDLLRDEKMHKVDFKANS
ncbi:MAG: transcription antitermination factor NusB [Bacteroidota bacterium]|nr:transcription antitermination factor NusB [Bacteroidota bacterium]MDP4218583.1 transcription antitermination factor NusB [Bacteroidota bacterium]MDP4255569.1 transcription antitermination factor NusB [Bacteroidota bacterium]MDP4260859.1 transcription antitermination factor NusB [Bacteroidota bacterium]